MLSVIPIIYKNNEKSPNKKNENIKQFCKCNKSVNGCTSKSTKNMIGKKKTCHWDWHFSDDVKKKKDIYIIVT